MPIEGEVLNCWRRRLGWSRLWVLDFGISLRIDDEKVLCQTNYFPKELLKICGELGIGIELSIYSNDMEAILEERRVGAK